MKLTTTTRDTAITGGAIALTLGIAYAVLDDISPVWRRRSIEDTRGIPLGTNYDLYRIGSQIGGGAGTANYVRPASEDEQKSSDAADQLDGVGVFGINREGQHVLPGTPEWDLALTDNYDARLTYYRVG